MRNILPFALLFLLVGCVKPHWTQTTDGKHIYGAFKDKYNLQWDGPVNAAFVDGEGQLSIYDDEGRLKDEVSLNTELGALSGYTYTHTAVGDYLGEKKKGLPHGTGVLVCDGIVTIGQFKKGHLGSGRFEQYKYSESGLLPQLIGVSKNGKVTGVTKEYCDGSLVYEGSYLKGQRNGFGQAYENDNLIYSGEWKGGKRHGDGTQYKENGLLVYQGEWKNDQYDGHGKLYDSGICQEGKWDDGRLTKSISTSFITEISRATKMWFSSDSLDLQSEEFLQENTPVAPSQIEFIEGLNNDLRDYLASEIDERVDKRFGFWHLLRMIFQPWFSSDVNRADAAQKFFCKNIPADEVQHWINEKVDYYNRNSSDELSYIKLEKLPEDSIVDTRVAIKIFDREALETTDVGVGILVDILVCLVIAFIIGFIIGFISGLSGSELPGSVAIIDIIMAVIAFGIGLYLSVFRTTPISLELESTIKQMLVDNYMLFIDSQNIISQLLGL